MAKKSSGSTFKGSPIFSYGNTTRKPSSPVMSPSNISGESGMSSKERMLRAMQPNQQQEEPFSMTQSFEKIIGSGQPTSTQQASSFGGFGGGLPSLGQLEASSMRLADAAAKRELAGADAAAKRELAGKQAEAEMEARMKGYGGIEDIMKSMRRQRSRSQYQY
jgi:hypothetical protein